MSQFRFAGEPLGGYEVFDRLSGEQLGVVRKHSRYYNLAPRGLWVTHWNAYQGGAKIGQYGKRSEAAEALLKQKETAQ